VEQGEKMNKCMHSVVNVTLKWVTLPTD